MGFIHLDSRYCDEMFEPSIGGWLAKALGGGPALGRPPAALAPVADETIPVPSEFWSIRTKG